MVNALVLKQQRTREVYQFVYAPEATAAYLNVAEAEINEMVRQR